MQNCGGDELDTSAPENTVVTSINKRYTYFFGSVSALLLLIM